MQVHGGFKIDIVDRLIKVRFYGAWNKETSEKLRAEFREEASKLSKEPWACLVNLLDWELGGPDVWEAIIILNHWCAKNNQILEAVVCDKDIEEHIFRQLQKELPNTESAFFQTEGEALKWLAAKGYP